MVKTYARLKCWSPALSIADDLKKHPLPRIRYIESYDNPLRPGKSSRRDCCYEKNPALKLWTQGWAVFFSPCVRGDHQGSSSAPCQRGGQGVRSLLLALAVCFAGSAWGQVLQV